MLNIFSVSAVGLLFLLSGQPGWAQAVAPKSQPPMTKTQPPAAKSQPPAGKSQPPAGKSQSVPAQSPPAAKASEKAPTPPLSADDTKKVAILNSTPWRRAMFEFNEWLSTQQLFNKPQVEQIKVDFTKRVDDSTSQELQLILSDLEAKFQIMDTKDAQEARAWMAQYLSILSSKKRAEVISSIPNVATMTAAQLNREIQKIDFKRESIEQDRAQAQQPQQPIKSPWATSTIEQQAYIYDHAITPGAYTSPYRPAPLGKRPFDDVSIGPQMGYYLNGDGQLGITFPASFW